uniref:Ig-like domain-containing protein n=1 Tax=Spermophilus dauricus TaxID=99837 RepID=A0A8C9UTW2_SPEDA
MWFLEAPTQSVTQPDRHVLVSEGAPLQLRCSYSSSVSPYLFWYQQRPSQGPQLLLKYVSGATLVTGISGFQAELRKNETSFHLRKPSAHWSDSAEYFCALGGTIKKCNIMKSVHMQKLRFFYLSIS